MRQPTVVHVPCHVHAAAAASGATFLLDGRSGQWHVLNATATALWRELGRLGDVEHVIGTAAAQYAQPTADVFRADARHVVGDMLARGLIAPGVGASRPPMTSPERPEGILNAGWAQRAPSVREHAGLLIALVLLRLPFHLTTRLIELLLGRWCSRAATVAEAVSTVAAVDAAADRHFGRVACLERSLGAVVTAALSRQRMRWVIGAAEDPVRFHAWVEVDGLMVDRSPEWTAVGFVKVLTL
ncbi:lasso peptide biosynthesis B2 protein [Actinosynnema sp. NPDC047251]|uniref:Microcin J25-processing protein McjB C-terminal domain-containing protein n=1 Tax=Saccharothrix espanaensis (strain ATCC 51144 / DSM 44229 / JCM 9112 / NBRC 15066 / NRRL 15764) TaxID=1179773 RepID=K0K567_SACES|nr:lasso peptide biosynthesis B2 protein [Saccharothrix espanaensis]CCH32727.1 hypothetical protein BN6_54680 [Saccharothrix espanaensis DSM 44229]